MPTEDRSFDFGRIHGFSDGVFAFAITLMVLSFDVPKLAPGEVEAKLPQAIWSQLPTLQSYIVSFMVIGSFWFSHHEKFKLIRKHDMAFVWLNLLFLMCIAFLPFPTALVGEYDTSLFAVVFYSLSLVVTGLMFSLLWIYATYKRKLVDLQMPRKVIVKGVYLSMIIPLIFTFSAIVSFVDVQLAKLSWLLVLIVPFCITYFSSKVAKA